MSQSPRYARKGIQIALDDIVVEVEVIRGSIPAGTKEADAARDHFYRGIAAGKHGECAPDQKIHVFDIGASKCACAAKKEDL